MQLRVQIGPTLSSSVTFLCPAHCPPFRSHNDAGRAGSLNVLEFVPPSYRRLDRLRAWMPPTRTRIRSALVARRVSSSATNEVTTKHCCARSVFKFFGCAVGAGFAQRHDRNRLQANISKDVSTLSRFWFHHRTSATLRHPHSAIPGQRRSVATSQPSCPTCGRPFARRAANPSVNRSTRFWGARVKFSEGIQRSRQPVEPWHYGSATPQRSEGFLAPRTGISR